MKTTHIAVCAIIAAIALAFTACDNGDPDINPGVPFTPHAHDWGDWGATTIEGTEQRTCTSDSSHIQHRLTGTDRFTFTPASSTSYRVRKGTVIIGAVVIPAYYRPDTSGDHLTNRGYLPVTEIGDDTDWVSAYNDGGAFSATGIDAVNIPDTITSIGSYAFYNCGLDNVTIPASVTTIGSYAFSECRSLTSVTIPSSVKSIGNYVFSDCYSLASVTIPASVITISYYAFSNCTSLTTVIFAAGSQLQTIGGSAFSGCTSLASITIPAGVTAVGENAFYGWYWGSWDDPSRQKIYVEGYAGEAEADAAWGNWRSGCIAEIIYSGG